MITCPSCNHQNPEGSLQCENCYTPLPATTSCPNCGASVQTDATFCGQCGFNLQAEFSIAPPVEETAIGSPPNMPLEDLSPSDSTTYARENSDILPETAVSFPIKSPWDMEEESYSSPQAESFPEQLPNAESTEVMEETAVSDTEFGAPEFTEADETPRAAKSETSLEPNLEPFVPIVEEEPASEFEQPDTDVEPSSVETPDVSPSEMNAVPSTDDFVASGVSGATQLQMQVANLLHLQSNTTIEIPNDLDVVHLGKPNGQIPPDIDVAGFPNSEVVSRVHADIRIEGNTYYIEDVGSSNGTYINHAPLIRGNRHRLRAGDRIALGKGDLVSFIFQIG